MMYLEFLGLLFCIKGNTKILMGYIGSIFTLYVFLLDSHTTMLGLLKRQTDYDEDIEKGSKKMDLFVFKALGAYPDLNKNYWFSVIYVSFIFSQLIFSTVMVFFSASIAIQMKVSFPLVNQTFLVAFELPSLNIEYLKYTTNN